MGMIRDTYNGIRSLVYYVVLALLGAGGLVMLYESVTSFELDSAGLSLFMILASLIVLGFPLLAVREKLRDRKLLRWLAMHVEELGEGVKGPGGMVYSFDTEFVRYQANLSLVFISTDIQSGFYLRGSNNLVPKTLYTFFTIVFGWWFLDLEVIVDNFAKIGRNLSDSNLITVAELFEIESSEADPE